MEKKSKEKGGTIGIVTNLGKNKVHIREGKFGLTGEIPTACRQQWE